MPGTAPCAEMNAAIRANASRCALFHNPRQVPGDSSTRLDVGRLGKDQPRPADCARGEVAEMPVGRRALRSAVLTHRRQREPIAQRHRADRERPKKVGATVTLKNPPCVFVHGHSESRASRRAAAPVRTVDRRVERPRGARVHTRHPFRTDSEPRSRPDGMAR